MFLLNLSSNVNAKFYIGSALTRLNDLGDMYVSSIYKTPDRQGGEYDYANCCIQLNTDITRDALREVTKKLEAELGRGQIRVSESQVVIDIDILAYQADGENQTDNAINWQFIEKRLPLTDGECWAIAELDIEPPNPPKRADAVLASWQL